MNRISGIKNIHIAQVTADGYATPIRLKGAKNLTISDNKNSIVFYSDNQADYTANMTASKEISIELAYLDPEIISIITGRQFVEGGLVSTADDVQNAVALMYELTTLEGKSVYNVLYNVKLDLEGSGASTITENVEEQNQTLVGMAIVNEEGIFEYTLDSNFPPTDPADVTKFNEKIGKWFTAVQLPVTVQP